MRALLIWIAIPLWVQAAQLTLDVNARSAILMNAETGAILFEKKAHEIGYPASTTKVATSLYLLSLPLNLERECLVSADSLRGRSLKDPENLHPYWLDSDSTLMGLKRGEKVSVEALLYGLMLMSGNDAANVLAESIHGNVPAFVEQLNRYIASLGCKHTQFQNPHGLHHPMHYTTAYDMALITKKALKYPKFLEIFSSQKYAKPKSNKQNAVELKLTHPFTREKSRFYYDKAIGAKTGYTAAAKYPFVSVASHEGRTLIAVLLACDSSQDRYLDAKKLFEAAFSEKKQKRRLVGSETIFTRPLATSTTALKACLTKPLQIEYFPTEEPECKASLCWQVEQFPVYKGQKVGEVSICDMNGVILQKGDLIALETVHENLFLVLRDKFLKLFR